MIVRPFPKWNCFLGSTVIKCIFRGTIKGQSLVYSTSQIVHCMRLSQPEFNKEKEVSKKTLKQSPRHKTTFKKMSETTKHNSQRCILPPTIIEFERNGKENFQIEYSVHKCPVLLRTDMKRIFPRQQHLFDKQPLYIIPTFQYVPCPLFVFDAKTEQEKDDKLHRVGFSDVKNVTQ